MAEAHNQIDPREERIQNLIEDLQPYEVEFCQAYVRLGYNGRKAVESVPHFQVTQANSAYNQSSLLLRNSKIKELIGLIAERGFVDARISVIRLLEHLGNRAFFDIRNYYHEGGRMKDLHELTDEEAAAVDGLVDEVVGYTGKGDEKECIRKRELKLCNPDRAVELLGKHHKMFTDLLIDVKVNLGDELVKAHRRARQAREGDDASE